MKQLCIALLFTVWATASFAQSVAEKEVAKKVEELSAAILHPSKEVLTALVADELTYGHSGGKVQNKQQFVDDLVNGPFHFLTLEATNQTISVAGDNAMVRHTLSFDFSNNGTNGHLNVGNLLVWKKIKGNWKLLARQAYKL